MLTIWGRRSSGNVQKVLWAAGELKLEYKHVPAGGPYGGLNDPEFLKKNPNGLVPVIEDDGMVLWESNAIVRYLTARYGKPPLWPDDPRLRAVADQWMDWSAQTFQPDILGVFVAYWRTPEAARNPQRIQTMMDRTLRDLQLLGGVLAQHRFLAGDEFSMADIATGAHLYRFLTMGFSLPKMPNIEAWYAGLTERPAYREHVMVSYEELRGRLTF